MEEKEFSKSILVALVVVALVVLYAIFCVSFEKSETIKEYPLIKIAGDKQPIYVSHRGLGYYYTYLDENGDETTDFIPGDKVREPDGFTTDNSRPRVEYLYLSGTYYFYYPGGAIEAHVKPYFDSIRFLVPEGAIANF